MSRLTEISFPNICGIVHIAPYVLASESGENNPHDVVREMSIAIQNILNEDGIASVKLPISFQDIKLARKHGRSPCHRWERLYTMLKAPTQGGYKLPVGIMTRNFLKWVQMASSETVTIQAHSGSIEPMHDFAMTLIPPSGSRSVLSYPVYWKYILDGVITSKLGFQKQEEEVIWIGAIFQIPVSVLPRLLVEIMGDPLMTRLRIGYSDTKQQQQQQQLGVSENNNRDIQPQIVLRDDGIQKVVFARVCDALFSSRPSESCRHGTCFQLPPNSGKTAIALRIAHEALFIKRTVNRVLVLTHTSTLKKQWESSIAKWFPFLPPTTTSSSSVKKNINEQQNDDVFRVYLFQGVPSGVGKEKKYLPLYTHSLQSDQFRTLVIVDEVHHMSATTFRLVINHSLPPHVFPYIFGMTGTLERKDGLAVCINILMSKPCFSMETIELNRHLHRFINYNIIFPIPTPDEPLTIEDIGQQVSENVHQLRVRYHRESTVRAEWMIQKCIIRDLIGQYGHTHVAILVLSIDQVRLLINTVIQLGIGHDVISSIVVHVGKKEIVSLTKLAAQYNNKNNDGCDGGDTLTPGGGGMKLTIGTMQLIGEGFHDDSIDCIIFADAPPDMVQNGNRLRNSDHGTLVYLTSYGLLGGTKRANADIKLLRTKLFATIENDIAVMGPRGIVPTTTVGGVVVVDCGDDD